MLSHMTTRSAMRQLNKSSLLRRQMKKFSTQEHFQRETTPFSLGEVGKYFVFGSSAAAFGYIVYRSLVPAPVKLGIIKESVHPEDMNKIVYTVRVPYDYQYDPQKIKEQVQEAQKYKV